MSFTIKIEPEALQDIQESIDWYNEQQPGLGHEFHSDVKATFKKIKSNPYFQVRYDNVRCLLMKKYPFMVYFTVDDKTKQSLSGQCLTHQEILISGKKENERHT